MPVFQTVIPTADRPPPADDPAIVYFKSVADVAAEFDNYAEGDQSPLRWNDLAPGHQEQIIAAYQSTVRNLLETLPEELELSWRQAAALHPT